jgi:hypothetical protein
MVENKKESRRGMAVPPAAFSITKKTFCSLIMVALSHLGNPHSVAMMCARFELGVMA